MAVIHHLTMPDGIPIQMVDEVSDRMNVEADPPAGLIVHTHYEQDGRVHIVDVWDSHEAYETFNAQRLGPTVGKVAGEHGIDLGAGPPPDSVVTELHRMVRGA